MKVLLFILCVSSFGQSVIKADGSKVDSKKILSKILSAEEVTTIKDKYLSSSNNDEETAIRLMTLDFAPYIKTLDRDIVTYNYREKDVVKIDSDEYLDINTKKGIDYAKEWSSALKKHTPTEGGMLGWGFYTSDNPQSSSGYARNSTDFALVTLRYKANSKMLDLRKTWRGYMLPVSERTMLVLRKLCPGLPGYDSINKSRLTKDRKCNKIFNEVLNKLNVAGLIYSWDDNRNRKCPNARGKKANAFVAVNAKIDEESVETFTNLPLSKLGYSRYDEKTEPDFLKKLKKAVGKDFTSDDLKAYQKKFVSFSMHDSHRFLGELKPFKPAEGDQKRFEKEILNESFGCLEKFAKKDAPHYNPDQAIEYIVKEGFKDLDLNAELEKKVQSCHID